MSKEAMKLALEALKELVAQTETGLFAVRHDHVAMNDARQAITALREALAEQPAQQEPVTPTAVEMKNAAANLALMREMWGNADEPIAKVNDDGFIVETGLLLSPGTRLYTSPPAQRTHECGRSHPHENMDAMCELRTEIARLTNENARLKARPQQEPFGYLYEGTAEHTRGKTVFQRKPAERLEKRWWREIGPCYTSPPAQRKPLTDEEIDELSRTMVKGNKSVNWLCRAIEAAHGIKENT